MRAPRPARACPTIRYDDWEVRLELVDEVDPGRWCTADDVWDGTPIAVEVAGGADHMATRSRRGAARWRATVAECVDVAADLARGARAGRRSS